MKYKMLEDKIKTIDELDSMADQWRRQGKSLVTNNGSYDIMHLGHVYGLFEAAQQGDVLVVGLNSDSSIKQYKSKDRPINDQAMRLRMLAAISCVDYVFLFDDTTPMSWLSRLRPQIHTNGAEYGSECIEREVVEAHGGQIYLLSMVPGYKTTSIIEKIKSIC